MEASTSYSLNLKARDRGQRGRRAPSGRLVGYSLNQCSGALRYAAALVEAGGRRVLIRRVMRSVVVPLIALSEIVLR